AQPRRRARGRPRGDRGQGPPEVATGGACECTGACVVVGAAGVADVAGRLAVTFGDELVVVVAAFLWWVEAAATPPTTAAAAKSPAATIPVSRGRAANAALRRGAER